MTGQDCLILTSYGDDEALFSAVMAGAAGYVLKQIHGTDLVSAVRTVAAGQSMLDPQAAVKLMARLRDQPKKNDALAALSSQEPAPGHRGVARSPLLAARWFRCGRPRGDRAGLVAVVPATVLATPFALLIGPNLFVFGRFGEGVPLVPSGRDLRPWATGVPGQRLQVSPGKRAHPGLRKRCRKIPRDVGKRSA